MPLPVILLCAVRKTLLFLNTNKVCGPEGITPRAVKESACVVVPVLTPVFRFILKTKVFPLGRAHPKG